MSLKVFAVIKTIIQLGAVFLFAFSVWESNFRMSKVRPYRLLMGSSLVLFFGVEFIGQWLVPGFKILVTPLWMRIALLAYGIFMILTGKKQD